MKTILAPNAPWPSTSPEEPKPAVLKPIKDIKPRKPYVKKIKPYTIKLMTVKFDEGGNVISMEPVVHCYTPRIEGCHSYKGQSANIFNEGFRAAERIYGIGKREQRSK